MKNIIKAELFKILFFHSLIFAFLSPVFAQTSNSVSSRTVYHPNPVLGLVDGKPVTFEDVRNKKVNNLSQQLHQQLNIQLMEYALGKLAAKVTGLPSTKPKTGFG
jgi:hypothetical protein